MSGLYDKIALVVCGTKNYTIELTIIGSGEMSDDQPYDQEVELTLAEAEELARHLLATIRGLRVE